MKKIKQTNKRSDNWFIRQWPFIVFSLILVFICRGFLFKPGYFLFGEFFGSTDFTFFLKNALQPWTDNSILGHSSIGFPITYGLHPAYMLTPPIPHILWFSLLSLIQIIFGVSWNLKIYIIFELFIPFTGMYFFALFWFNEHKKNRLLHQALSFTVSIIYTINVAIGDRIFAGHLFYPLGYGLMPLYLFFLCVSIEEKVRKKKTIFILLASLICSIILWIMPHLLILSLFFLFFYFFIFVIGDREKIKIFFLGGFISTAIGFLLNINLWFPALFYSESYPFFKNSVYILANVYNTSPYVTLDKILTSTSGGEKELLIEATYKSLFLLRLILPLLALILLIVNKNRKKSFFLFLLAVFGIIFGMGVNYPFEKFYGFLYEHIFLFEPFRDTSKFIIFYVFALSLILPTLFVYIYKYLRTWTLLIVFLFVIFLLYINPMFNSGNFAGNIRPLLYPKKYDVLKELLAKDKDYYRVAIYPNDKYVGDYDWFPKIPNGSIHPTIFSSMVPLSKGLAVSNRTVANYSSRFLDYIEDNLDKDWAIKQLGENSVKYIFIDPDMKGYERYENMISTNSAATKIPLIKGFDTYKINNFTLGNIKEKEAYYYAGDLSGLAKIPSNVALINIEHNDNSIVDTYYSDTIFLNSVNIDDVFYSTLKDYSFSFLPEVRFTTDGRSQFILLGEYLRDLTKKGLLLLSDETIGTSGESSIGKKKSYLPGSYRIILRILSSPLNSNNISVSFGEETIKKTNFQEENEKFIWLDLGRIEIDKQNPAFSIKNNQNSGLVVDSIIIIPEKEFKKRQTEFADWINKLKIIDIKNIKSIAKDSNKQEITVIPQSYSPYWDICGGKTFLVNFYSLGTDCENEKRIYPHFKPAKLFYFSLVASVAIHIFIFIFVIRLIFQKKK